MAPPLVVQLSKDEKKACERLLGKCEMFEKVPPHLISKLAGHMKPLVLERNDNLTRQGEPCEGFYLLESGDIRRHFTNLDTGRSHNVEFAIKAASINSMRVIAGEPSHNTVKCVSDTGCKLYEMRRTKFLELLRQEPEIAVRIAEGLSEELRRGSRKYATPLLQQRQQEDINMPAVSIAAGIESYYRSALNALLNARLTGVRAELFPNMHIQVPVRIAYMNGFKGLRSVLESKVDPDSYGYPNVVRLAMAVTPGVVMTPISSVLEASNAGHMNKESMHVRWMRGALPRGGREIIFGMGLNQMSDYFEERMQPHFPDNPMTANAVGSLTAGVVSGYFSHVPHNMSTYKLLEPHKSYKELYKAFVDKSVPYFVNQIVRTWRPGPRGLARTIAATLFPRGVLIRTTQIVGSFVILNGTINYLQLREHHKIQVALGNDQHYDESSANEMQ